MPMQVSVVSPERELYSGEADAVYTRSLDGEIGILPGHQPALLALAPALTTVHTTGGERVAIAVHGGFLQFTDNELTLLADTAELVSDIDIGRAEADKRRAEEELRADEDDSAAAARLARAELRIELASR